MSPEARWQARLPGEYVWASWDGEFALYHRTSGLTHFLNASAAALLTEILVEPRDIESASQMLASSTGEESSPSLRDQVAQMLLRLEELGLVDRASG